MGLKCSLLGHDFEAADVEREREEQGSEVVTVVRELERCSRCGAERVVSENTEVTAVVDAEDVDLDEDELGGGVGEPTDPDGTGGGFGGVVERSGAGDDPGADASDGSGDEEARRAAEEAAAAVDELAERPGEGASEEFGARDPQEEDTEILTDDDPEREPGEWPEEARGEWDDDADGQGGQDDDRDVDVDVDDGTESPPDVAGTEGEPLAGSADPERAIVCSECGFEVDPSSSYREGDPCPECSAWLTGERNP